MTPLCQLLLTGIGSALLGGYLGYHVGAIFTAIAFDRLRKEEKCGND